MSRSDLHRLISPKSIAVVGNRGADFAIKETIDLTVVGPELPLSKGIVNLFRSKNLNIFGPTQRAAQLESSKDFAKDFMCRHNIPTAKYKT